MPNGSKGAVTQLFQLENTQHPKKKLMVRIKIDFDGPGGHVTEQAQVSAFPQ